MNQKLISFRNSSTRKLLSAIPSNVSFRKARINFRDELGRDPFPEETPFVDRIQNGLLLAYNLIEIPMPKVQIPVVWYPDISKWQVGVDFGVMEAAGAVGCWIKCTQGAWIDPKFEEFTQAANDANFPVGFYSYLDPEQKTISARDAALLAADITQGKGQLSMRMDAERKGDLTPTKLRDYYLEWMDAYLEFGDLKLDYYTRLSFFNPNVARDERFGQYRLCAARYNLSLETPWSDGKFVPLDWEFEEEWFDDWQHSADGNHMGALVGVLSDSVDLNLAAMTEEEFKTYYGLNGTEPPPEPVEEGYRDRFITLFSGQNFRTEPSTSGGGSTVIKKLADHTVLVSTPCDTPGYEYTGMSTFAPGLDRPKEIWVHVVDPTGQGGWIALYHPSRSSVFLESIEPEIISLPPSFLTVKVNKDKDCPVYIPGGYDKVCQDWEYPEYAEFKPPGKPIPDNKIDTLPAESIVKVRAKGLFSCIDDPNTSEIITAYGDHYLIISEKYPAYAMIPAKRVTIIE